MINRFTTLSKSEKLGVVYGILSSVIGFVVILGWVLKSTILTQISPSFAPMQFTTALSFLLSGLTIVTFSLGKHGLSKVFLAVLGFVVGQTLLEYLFGVSIGIDNLFVDSKTEQAKTLFAGRMSPPTVFSFLMIWCAMFLVNFKPTVIRYFILISIISSITFALAISTLVGYLLEFNPVNMKLDLLGMAVHTAIGFMLISLGAFCLAISREPGVKYRIPRWVAAPLSVLVMCIAIVMWQSLITQEYNNLKNYIELQASNLKLNTINELKDNFEALQRMAKRQSMFKHLPEFEWQYDVTLYLEHFESFKSFTLVNSDLKVTGKKSLPVSFPTTAELTIIAKTLDSKSRHSYVNSNSNVNEPQLYFIAPMFNGDNFKGLLVTEINSNTLFEFGHNVEPKIEFSIAIESQGIEHVLFGQQNSGLNKSLISSIDFYNFGGNWHISTWPTDELVSSLSSSLPEVVLFGGLILSLFSFLVIYFGITARGQARELTELNESLEEKVQIRTKELKKRDEFNWNWLSKCTDGAWDWNLKDQTVFMTRQFKELLGYSEDELSSNVDDWRELVHPDDLTIADKAYQDYMNFNNPYIYQIRWRHKSGKHIWTLCRGEAIRNDSDEIIRMVGTLANISQLKDMEEILIESNKELEQFAYIASHDLQEPLRTVGSFVQLLQKRYQDKLDSSANEFIEFAVDGVERMQQLISDLLEYSRIETKGQEMTPTDIESVLESVKQSLQVLIRENKATITFGSLPTISVDSIQLSQVFQNLIGNAIKFKSDKPPEIKIIAENKDGYWLFSVQDNGIGLDTEFSDKVFVIFQRLHTREEYPGTGIGLSICKKIVQRHGGKIWVESEPGSGSTFYFTIPERMGVNNEYNDREQADRNPVGRR